VGGDIGADILAWLHLAVRWFHLTAGIAWIGSSFYFMWLDAGLRPNPESPKGVAGELWAVHGGGFYHKQKYLVAPETLPAELHWFKWEAYTTWITGFLLLTLVYYVGAAVYLVDPQKAALEPWQAVAIGLAFLAGGWLVYDGLCRSPIGQNLRLFSVVWFLVLTASAWALTRIFDDRGAFIHVGAMIGTAMVGNVFLVIIPNQRKVVASMLAREAPDPKLGKQAKQRSMHNNYMTLPVLFLMVSNHFPMVFAHPLNWLLLAGIGASGWTIRHFFNLKNAGRKRPMVLVNGVMIFVAVFILAEATQPRPKALPAGAAPASLADVQGVVRTHCLMCHSASPTHEGFTAPPNGVAFDTPAQLRQYAPRIFERAVATDSMPLGNETGMTPADRETLGRWIKAGAH
jgi:uncharacterized membrane protein